jgi:hypothetical protein
MNGGWTISAAAHIWALNGFSEEIDMGHEGKRFVVAARQQEA